MSSFKLSLLVTCFVFWGSVLNAAQYGDFEYEVVNGSVTILSYSGSDARVDIPETINLFPVTKIGDSAFKTNYTLVDLGIGGYVTEIGDSAFKTCTNLEIVENLDYVTNISNEAFSRLISSGCMESNGN